MKSSVLSIVTFALVQALTAVCAFGGIWEGKSVSVVGDSYSAFGGLHGSIHYHYPGKTMVRNESQMWWAQVIDEFGGTILSNRSCTGSAIYTTYGNSPSLLSMARNGQLGDPDVILVMGGLNDCWVGEEPWKLNESKFAGAVASLFNCLDAEYARAEKYVIVHKIHVREDYRWGLKPMYRNVLRKQAKERGYKVVDLDGYFGTEDGDFDTAETPHPTLQGMTKIAKRVISEIRNGPGGYKELFDYLETDSKGYLVTDYVPNLAKTKVVVNAQFFDKTSKTSVFYSADGRNCGLASSNVLSLVERNGGFYFVNSTDGGKSSVAPANGLAPPLNDDVVTITTAGNSLGMGDAVLAIAREPADVSATGHLVLFGERTGSGGDYTGMAPKKIYGIRIYEGTTLVRDFCPALSKEGVATLYDRMTDQCLPVYGGGEFHVMNYDGAFVNFALFKAYDDLSEAYADARAGDTVTVRTQPAEPVSVMGRMGVAIDCGGYENVEMKVPSQFYKIVRTGNVLTLADNENIRPAIDCGDMRTFFKPVDGIIKVHLENVLDGLSYAVFTAADLKGPWTPVGNGFEVEKADFEVPAPPPGTKAFFIKAVVRE